MVLKNEKVALFRDGHHYLAIPKLRNGQQGVV